MIYSTEIRDSQSGTHQLAVRPASGDWGRSRTPRMRTTVFRTKNDGLTQAQRLELFNPWERTIAHRFNNGLCYSGLITGWSLKESTGALAVRHIDIMSLLARRHYFGVGSYDPTDAGVLRMVNMSLRGIIARLIYLGLVHPYSAAWVMPVDVELPEAGGLSREFFAYDFQSVEELISSLSQEVAGPDIDLQPKDAADGTLRYDARIGSPFLTGPELPEHWWGGRNGLTNVELDWDAERAATGIFTLGRGDEEDMRVGSAAQPVSVGVSRDYSVSTPQIDDFGILDSRAAAELAAVSGPREQWSASVSVKDAPPDKIRLGSTTRFHVQNHPMLPDGPRQMRVIGYSAPLNSRRVRLDLEKV